MGRDHEVGGGRKILHQPRPCDQLWRQRYQKLDFILINCFLFPFFSPLTLMESIGWWLMLLVLVFLGGAFIAKLPPTPGHCVPPNPGLLSGADFQVVSLPVLESAPSPDPLLDCPYLPSWNVSLSPAIVPTGIITINMSILPTPLSFREYKGLKNFIELTYSRCHLFQP